ncbi:DUF3341 domain-containing protein [Candidatus Walczuchella monophlebidarum]|uniref:Quinol:cytochrome c oxidoreductase membrane protein n=1 Tax=Candidatus Walczuchella monophlebidarum TaxID=1415657 RepID=A0A068DP01_9FLAO|nr:DUF3341 domain-containing protein [Candidatus Walczuchella monophlebidarum]AID37480.1 hypothetical protein FNIIJ_214 [Candidatus Walczuchella monophlebidarum]
MRSESTKIIYGIYDDDDLLIKSINILNKKGISIHEVYTPFPVHGVDKAIGLKKTRISYLAFFYGCFGTAFACLLSWYTMIHDWPQDIGGKPNYSLYVNLPSFVPILFEITIFCAAHFMCLTYLIRCGLFPCAEPKNPDPRTTDDKFLIEIHTKTDVNELVKQFQENGAIEISVKDKP